MTRLRRVKRLIIVCVVLALIALFTPVAMAKPAPKKVKPGIVFTTDGLAADEGMY